MNAATIKDAIENLVILMADGNSYHRRIMRAMLVNSGAKSIYEVGDGVAALDAIRNVNPDVMILNWDLPGLDGPEVMRIVRSPEVFPKSNLPIVMVSDTGQRSRVISAIKLGVHEVLVRPISPKALQQRLFGIVLHPRPMVQAGRYYIPLPRRSIDRDELTVAA